MVVEPEADCEEPEQGRADQEAGAEPEARDLRLQLQACELHLESRQRARVLGDLLGRGSDSQAISLAGVHVPSSRSPSQA